MTKKDYQAIARAFHISKFEPCAHGYDCDEHLTVEGGPFGQWRTCVEEVANVLSADNPRFDRETFVAACETGDVTRRPKRKREVSWRSRDLGYGIEEGIDIGTWGETDTWGKRKFTRERGAPLYLFPDEIISDERE